MSKHPINYQELKKSDLEKSEVLDLFDIWGGEKKKIHYEKNTPYFYVGEIWWAKLGKNISSEALGKGKDFLRPVLVLQKFFGKSALVIPLSSRGKDGSYYFSFENIKGGLHTALLPQVRYVDGKRLSHKLSEVSPEVFKMIKEKFISLL